MGNLKIFGESNFSICSHHLHQFDLLCTHMDKKFYLCFSAYLTQIALSFLTHIFCTPQLCTSSIEASTWLVDKEKRKQWHRKWQERRNQVQKRKRMTKMFRTRSQGHRAKQENCCTETKKNLASKISHCFLLVPTWRWFFHHILHIFDFCEGEEKKQKSF